MKRIFRYDRVVQRYRTKAEGALKVWACIDARWSKRDGVMLVELTTSDSSEYDCAHPDSKRVVVDLDDVVVDAREIGSRWGRPKRYEAMVYAGKLFEDWCRKVASEFDKNLKADKELMQSIAGDWRPEDED